MGRFRLRQSLCEDTERRMGALKVACKQNCSGAICGQVAVSDGIKHPP